MASTVVPGLAVDPASDTPLQRQLYAALRTAILEQRLRAGTRVPSSRHLADAMALSRTTVSLAYDQLRAEGYLEGRERSGTFVASALPDDHLQAVTPARPRPHAPSPVSISARGRVLAQLSVSSSLSTRGYAPHAFRLGTPALDHFPFALWGRLLSRHWRALTTSQLAYGDPAGHVPLREAIAAYARQARAVDCEASQVIVVSGAQQAFDLIARVLLDPGDSAIVEDPRYRGIRSALVGAGAQLVPVPVDGDGLTVEGLRDLAPGARLACVTPSHHFPLGMTMSAPRRLALLDWARATDAWIVEDDFDSEYRFRGRPLPSLHGLDAHRRVLYVGTFSKTLFPAIRLGYLIVPPALVDVFARARAISDRHPPALEQAALAEFIAEGHFARHVRRMRALYAERQATLVALLREQLADHVEVEPGDAGMHLVAWMREGLTDTALAARADEAGVVTAPLSGLSTRPLARGALLLGYAAFDAEAMRRGVRALHGAARARSTARAVTRPRTRHAFGD